MAITSEQLREIGGHGAAPRHKFCPDAGVMSASGMQTRATAAILLRLLRPLSLIMLLGSLAFLGRELIAGDRPPHVFCYVTTAVVGVLTAWLFLGRGLARSSLRLIELGLFLAAGAQVAAVEYEQIVFAATYGEPGLVVAQLNRALAEFVILMAAYAIFIPNSAWRAGLVLIPLALGAPLLWLIVGWWHPEVVALAAPALGFRAVTDIVLLTGIALAVSLMGTALIGRYRSVAMQAQEANLYDLKRKIGEGGMGEVWLAQHQALARPAAIKIVRPDLVADGDRAKGVQAVKRFAREAQATASLRSAHTVEIYDFGVTQDGTFYYVMEYLDGLDLGTLVRKHGPLPPARVIYLLRQAASSLEDAHARALIHRDIKPANLFTCRMGSECDFVKVLDFGLVKDQGPTEHTQLTVDGLTTGTPAYMAPEMALQDGRVGPPSDIYALGCVAYWLLTGKLVFDDPTPVAMIVSHVKTEPKPPSTRTELSIPSALDRIVLQCLQKEPEDRYRSMREFADALAGVETAETWGDRQAEDWWRLHRPAAELPEIMQRA
jgi:serine/threonine-protein kinase